MQRDCLERGVTDGTVRSFGSSVEDGLTLRRYRAVEIFEKSGPLVRCRQ